MAYCRWSSDNFQCDVYVYEDVKGGWTTHVAGSRRKYLYTLPPGLPDDAEPLAAFKRWKLVMNAQHDLIGIDLPHAGETFNDPTPWACAQRLKELKSIGFNVPDGVIQELEAEGKDEVVKFVEETLNNEQARDRTASPRSE